MDVRSTAHHLSVASPHPKVAVLMLMASLHPAHGVLQRYNNRVPEDPSFSVHDKNSAFLLSQPGSHFRRTVETRTRIGLSSLYHVSLIQGYKTHVRRSMLRTDRPHRCNGPKKPRRKVRWDRGGGTWWTTKYFARPPRQTRSDTHRFHLLYFSPRGARVP